MTQGVEMPLSFPEMTGYIKLNYNSIAELDFLPECPLL